MLNTEKLLSQFNPVTGEMPGAPMVKRHLSDLRGCFADTAAFEQAAAAGNPLLYSVGAVTTGTDAQAKVTVRLEEDGKMVDGQGADTDTIVASARAYIHALNKLLVKRARTEPAALAE